MKRLKNIEGKNKEQLEAIEDQGNKQSDAIKNIVNTNLNSVSYFSQLSPEAKVLFGEIKKEKDDIDPKKHVFVKSNGEIFNFTTFKISLQFASNIYHKGATSLKNASKSQQKLYDLLKDLEAENLKKPRQNKI